MTLYMGSIDKALWIHKTEEKALSYENLTWKNSEPLGSAACPSKNFLLLRNL